MNNVKYMILGIVKNILSSV